MTIRKLTTAGESTAHIDLPLAGLAPGETLELPARGETVAVILAGRIDATVDGTRLGVAGGRTSVFEAPGDAVYAPPGAATTLTAHGDGPARRWRSPRRPQTRLRTPRRRGSSGPRPSGSRPQRPSA